MIVVALTGTYKEMVWGLMLGFFLGLICLFWFRESVFTRRHQMGKIMEMAGDFLLHINVIYFTNAIRFVQGSLLGF
jgi:hypothetical protein